MKFVTLFSDNGLTIHEYIVNANRIICRMPDNNNGLLKHGSAITVDGMDIRLYSSHSPSYIVSLLEEDG